MVIYSSMEQTTRLEPLFSTSKKLGAILKYNTGNFSYFNVKNRKSLPPKSSLYQQQIKNSGKFNVRYLNIILNVVTSSFHGLVTKSQNSNQRPRLPRKEKKKKCQGNLEIQYIPQCTIIYFICTRLYNFNDIEIRHQTKIHSSSPRMTQSIGNPFYRKGRSFSTARSRLVELDTQTHFSREGGISHFRF